MKKIFILVLVVVSSTLFSQQFPTNENDVLKEVENLKINDEGLLVVLYTYYSDLTEKYSGYRAIAHNNLESANGYVLGRSKEQKLKDLDKAQDEYNRMNDLYKKSFVSADLYYQLLNSKYPSKHKKVHDK